MLLLLFTLCEHWAEQFTCFSLLIHYDDPRGGWRKLGLTKWRNIAITKDVQQATELGRTPTLPYPSLCP